MNKLTQEPVAAAAIVNAIVAVALIFGFKVPVHDVGIIVPALSIVLGLIARARVSPVPSPPAPPVSPSGSETHKLG